MVSFTGRSTYTVKLPGKPIPEGYKAWVLGAAGGYYLDWLLYSSSEGPEACTRKRKRLIPQSSSNTPIALTETFQVPVLLCERLRSRSPSRNWLLFLDNLFLNVDVAYALLHLGVGVMGTTRKNSSGLPEP